MRIIRITFKTILFIIEKLIAEFAILAAILSIVHQGSYIDRAIGGMTTIYNALYGFGHAYIVNIGFRDFMGNLTANVLNALASIAINIQSDPRQVLTAFIITYVAYKIIALLLKVIRKKLLKGEKSYKKSRESDESSGTYKQLYNDN